MMSNIIVYFWTGKIASEDRKKENNQIRMDNNGKILNVRSKENKNG